MGGANGTSQPARPAAEQLRLPLRARTTRTICRRAASSRSLAGQVQGARRGHRVPQRRARRRHPVAGHQGPAHVRQRLRHAVDHDPRHGGRTAPRPSTPTRSPRASARRSSGPRTACSVPARSFREFFFTETGDTNALTEAGARATAASAALFKLSQQPPFGQPGHAEAVLPGRRRAHRLRQHRVLVTKDRLVVGRGRGRHAAHAAQRARLGLALRRTARLLESGQPADPDPRPGPRRRRPPSTRRCSARHGFQNDGDNEITGIHVSDGDPAWSASSARRSRTPFDGELARLLHAAARRQRDVRDHPQPERPRRPQRGRPRLDAPPPTTGSGTQCRVPDPVVRSFPVQGRRLKRTVGRVATRARLAQHPACPAIPPGARRRRPSGLERSRRWWRGSSRPP